MPSGQEASAARRIIYYTPYDSYCAIIAAVIVRAYEDARGHVEQEPENKQKRVDIILDAAQYFNDDRYEWHMELLGRDPAVKPDWSKQR